MDAKKLTVSFRMNAIQTQTFIRKELIVVILKENACSILYVIFECVIQFVWASEKQVGPVDFKGPLARGPVGKNPNVAA